MNIYVQVSVGMCASSSLGSVPTSGIAGSCCSPAFDTWWNCQTVFPGGCTILHFCQQVLHILINTRFLSDFNQLSAKWYFILALHFPDDAEHLFIGLLAICLSSFEKYPFRSFALFKIGLFVFLLLNCKSSLFWMQALCQLYTLHTSSPILWAVFTFLFPSFEVRFFILSKAQVGTAHWEALTYLLKSVDKNF